MLRRIYTGSWLALAGLLVLASPAAAAEEEKPAPDVQQQLQAVIQRLQNWLTGLLFIGATLMMTVAGLLYMTAGGNPTQIEKAKTAFRSALVGYALAALAPILVGILKSLVG